jgi:hypothetical protein
MNIEHFLTKKSNAQPAFAGRQVFNAQFSITIGQLPMLYNQ